MKLLFQNKKMWRMAAIAVMLFTTGGIRAQLIGWPALSSDPEVDASPGTISTLTYMDDIRARVTAMTTPAGTPQRCTLTLTDINSAFVNNKWCILIQMEGSSNVGNNGMVKVISSFSSGGFDYMIVELVTGNAWPTLSLGASDRVQIVEIPVYWNLTLASGGIITCNKYDHASGTGGVLPLIIGGTLTINGGYFTTIGTGYKNGLGTLGVGGNGATAMGAGQPTTPVGYNSCPGPYAGGDPGEKQTALTPWGNICPNVPVPPILNINRGTAGSSGEIMSCAGTTPGTNTTGEIKYYPTISPLTSTFNTILRMGDAGDAGMKGGDGGCAGGYGGNGGANGAGILSTSTPQSGANGDIGGNAAAGGSGGGVMYIKLANATISSSITAISSYTLFYADGGQGGNATDGGDGGDGGKGAMGADGTCFNGNTLNTPGGWGGFGQSGKGGGGGWAGAGGKPGTIWIIKKSGGAFTTGLSRYYRVKGGQGGGGGRGGYSREYLGAFSAKNYFPNSLSLLPCVNNNWTFCPPPTPPCSTVICDCDKVFKHWGENGGADFTVSGPVAGVYTIALSGAESLKYNGSVLSLEKTIGGCVTRYDCYMIRQAQFHNMMLKAMAITYPLKTYIPSSGSTVLVGTNRASYNSTTFVTTISFRETSSPNKVQNVFTYDAITDELTDIDDPLKPVVVAAKCNETEGENTGSGSGGGGEEQVVKTKQVKTGEDAPDGADAPDGTSDNQHEEDGGAFVFFKNDANGQAPNNNRIITTYENNQVVFTGYKPIENNSTCMIYSVDGKLISTQNFNNNKATFDNVSNGIYILVITQNGISATQRILIDR